ncbi:hypothetical protein [Azospirillum rugosum]|uniref:RNase H-like nuclease (RuvC/YqgF family) n=1 Tax=Azospirillum rugosum TaxID=416170 RepID=A0ABS4ST28_9PROT|nr:hypothetical protein [Azospirillum rugosum]MBP2295253.1 putative RNase H-like nuclease (RuvC/YqgF family) [Azospirillum rugosum]MDQ0528627.1 putative RNase H-like nuclease (RuvC/YqgF family) [Azospirillum rugosum]
MSIDTLMRCSAAGILALLLAGCVTTDDPRKGGFLSAVQNSVLTDGYKQREAREQAVLDRETDRQSALEQRAAAMRRQRSELNQEITTLQRQTGPLDGQLQSLRAQLATSRDTVKREKVELAIQRLQTVKTSLKSTDWQQQSIPEASSRLKEIKAMMQDVTDIAEAAR